MERTKRTRLGIVAGIAMLVAAPAAAASDNSIAGSAESDYNSLTAITAGAGDLAGSAESDYNSLTAITAGAGDLAGSAESDYNSLTAITAGADGSAATDAFGTVNSLVGSVEPVATPAAESAEGGFDWGDALIGALVATGLVLLAGGTARFVARSRHRMAGSHA